MSQAIINFFAFLPDWLEVFIISAIPIVELRGAIPWGTLVLHMPYLQVFLLSWLGSIIPAPFILLFLPAVLNGCGVQRFLAPLPTGCIQEG